MASIDENSGLFTAMVGMIVLVMSGIGLTVLVDKRFSFSKSSKVHQFDIENNYARLESLTFKHEQLQSKFDHGFNQRTPLVSRLKKATASLEDLTSCQKRALEEKQLLEASLAELEQEFSDYRSRYVTTERTRAIGEQLGTLQTTRGASYHEAVISKVTDAGLEIRHQHGIARLQPSELDPSYQDRFQWSAEERRMALLQEKKQAKSALHPEKRSETSPSRKRSLPSRPANSSTSPSPVAEDLQTLRLDVVVKKNRVNMILTELHTSRRNSGRHPNRSFGSTLETWEARSNRLQTELVKARAELALAEARLNALYPQYVER